MSKIAAVYDECYVGTPKTLMTRIVGAAATAITQATLSGLSYLVKRYASRANAENDTNGTSVTAETTLTISACIFDTLQTDNDWRVDSQGYNFKYTVPAATFDTAGQWYVIEVWCDPQSGDDFLGGLFFLHCKPTRRGS